jgi:hypothetical protein
MMQEDFLHHIWKYQKFETTPSLKTTQNEDLTIFNLGQHNTNRSGPDFFNAKVKIGKQVWAGNIEIHIKSSDWYAHEHEKDKNYDNVILHVVWEDDVEVYRTQQEPLTCLELKHVVKKQTLDNYKSLIGIPSKAINCEKHFKDFDDFVIQNWLERLFIERLEDKTKLVSSLLNQNQSDWEDVLFKLIAKNFGLNKNGEAFLDIAHQIGYKIISKHHHSLLDLESLFLGTGGFLEVNAEHEYVMKLKSNYEYLKHKYQLKPSHYKADFFRLRPDNFPTIRLAQLSAIYHKTPQLFQKLINLKSKSEIHKIFKIELSEFWDTHYSLTKESRAKKKKLSAGFVDLLIINTIIPLKFQYEKHVGSIDYENLFSILNELKPEQNSKVSVFEALRPNTNRSAFHSQALLHLKSNYCDKNYCLKCHLGKRLINKDKF